MKIDKSFFTAIFQKYSQKKNEKRKRETPPIAIKGPHQWVRVVKFCSQTDNSSKAFTSQVALLILLC